MSDFEQGSYVWLPGGTWSVSGTAFGSGPAQGTLSGQQRVDGYLGNGFADSFNGGDASTGTLISPPFTIQRNYIKFLIGGGSYRGEGGYGGETRIDLLVGGQVVRHAAGPGAWEHLDWEQWDVRSLVGQTAQIQIVDTATGGWGHLNVDEIVQSNTSLTNGVITPTHRYINFPVKSSNPSHTVALLVNGLAVQEFNIHLGTASNYDFYAFLDLSAYQGTQMVVRVDSTNAPGGQLSGFVQSDTPVTSTPFYQETLRPIYHFSARRGFINDPNGIVYFNGEYHLCFQHNPYDLVVGNQNWGNAVSPDLVHWQELPEAIYGDALGQAWSGSSVVDWNNTAGFGAQAIVSFYTSAGGHGNNNLMSEGQLFSQSLAYSLDFGRTFIKYTNNPIVPNVAGDNRDPKVIWYAPGNKWVMALWLQNNDYGFFSSTDLKHWTQTSTFTFPNVIEVPELFPLPLDGNTNNLDWIFYAGAGNYYVGQFDGNVFTAQYGPFSIRGGNSFAAGQTFNKLPASDGRRILMANGTGNYPGMPFNATMDFPVELTLQTTGSTPLIFVNPVREIALLHTSTNFWPNQPLSSGNNIVSGASGEAYELDARFQPGGASQITFNLGGTQVVYDNVGHQVTCSGISQPLNPNPTNGVVHLRMLVDRGSVEIYGNDGLVYMPMSVTPVAGSQAISLVANGSGAQLISLYLYNLGLAWNYPLVPPPPVITAQPQSVHANLGGTASFNVTALGVAPLTYQWRVNGLPISGATNSTLSVFPIAGTNANYDVIITGSGGNSVTSSVAPLIVRAPYKISYWRMEAQATTPNTSGTPAFNGVLDSATATGQGIVAVGTVVPASEDDLITFNGASGGVALSNSVPPAAMFVNGNSGGTNSYNAAAIAAVDGALFFPQDQYGNEFSFTSPFSIELFFRTFDDQSGAGRMELVMQGENYFRYGIIVNEAGAGSVRFAANNGNTIQDADLTGRNYADGQWHYLLAVYDALSGANGQVRLKIVNQDGSEATATNMLPVGFGPLPAGSDGNLFIGRNTYSHAQDPRTFLGLIDEVQITAGVVPDTWRVGKVPSIDSHPQIQSISKGAGAVSFQWSGATSTDFLVQWVARLGDIWQTIATLPSTNGANIFIDTDAGRLQGPESFYRIVSQ